MNQTCQSAHDLSKTKKCCANLLRIIVHPLAASSFILFFGGLCSAQDQSYEGPLAGKDNQIKVNWLYGSYVPKEVQLESLNSHRRVKLYVRQIYTGFGIYIKTTLFAVPTRFTELTLNGEMVRTHS